MQTRPMRKGDHSPTACAIPVGENHGARATGRARGSCVDHSPYGKDQFARLFVWLGKKKAGDALARLLFVAVWHVLTKMEADRPAVPAAGRNWSNGVTNCGQQDGITAVGKPSPAPVVRYRCARRASPPWLSRDHQHL